MAVVVLDPRTGDVLAIAIRPTFNPNAFLDVPSSDAWRNRAVTDPFEPGSTFKVIMAAAALEEGVVRPDDRIYAENGAITYREDDDPRLEEVRLADLRRGAAELLQRRLHQGRHVARPRALLPLHDGVRLRRADRRRPGRREPRPAARAARWSALSLPTMSIGQEISVTALQMVAAFGAIANGGTLMQPAPGPLGIRRRRQGDPAVRATRCPPGHLRRDRADADPD